MHQLAAELAARLAIGLCFADLFHIWRISCGPFAGDHGGYFHLISSFLYSPTASYILFRVRRATGHGQDFGDFCGFLENGIFQKTFLYSHFEHIYRLLTALVNSSLRELQIRFFRVQNDLILRKLEPFSDRGPWTVGL